MNVTWAEIAPEFDAITRRVVWAVVTTVDTRGRPRSRILHPIWDGHTGWIATSPQSLKAKHIAANPFVAVAYWDQQHEQVYAECRASWDASLERRQWLWELFKTTPPPLGYDPGMLWQGGPADPTFGALRLDPFRIEVSRLSEVMSGKPPRVWRPAHG